MVPEEYKEEKGGKLLGGYIKISNQAMVGLLMQEENRPDAGLHARLGWSWQNDDTAATFRLGDLSTVHINSWRLWGGVS